MPDPRNLRASDADRQRVADALGQAYADGRLTLQEHTDRVNIAWAAKTVGELSPLLADLPVAGPAPVPGMAPMPGSVPLAVAASQPLQLVSIFSGSRRQGDWTVPAQINNFLLFGGSHLDMRQAAFTSLDVVVQVGAIFSGVDIYVPTGVTVIDETVSIFGGVDMSGMTPPAPDAPVIHLRGFTLFGGVHVHGGEYKSFGERLGFTR